MIFPLIGKRFEHQFGIAALPPTESIFLRTDQFRSEITQKRKLIQEDHNNYVAVLPSAADSVSEVVCLIELHAKTSPPPPQIAWPELSAVGCNFQASLARASQRIQEDIVICSNDVRLGFPIIAGVVCFPSGWSIAEKIGQSIGSVHAKVPGFEKQMGRRTESLMDRLVAGRPVWRTNWGVRTSPDLDQSPKQAAKIRAASQSINATNAGSRCFFRVERQTLSRLPVTQNILFTIHTMQVSVDGLNRDQQQTLSEWLNTCPVETLRYKGIDSIKDPLIQWIDNQH